MRLGLLIPASHFAIVDLGRLSAAAKCSCVENPVSFLILAMSFTFSPPKHKVLDRDMITLNFVPVKDNFENLTIYCPYSEHCIVFLIRTL